MRRDAAQGKNRILGTVKKDGQKSKKKGKKKTYSNPGEPKQSFQPVSRFVNFHDDRF